MARVELNAARVPQEARLGEGDAAEALRRIHTAGHTLAAASLLGGGEAVLASTRDYANERVQFDRPIGAFQAVKHPLVDVMIELELSRSLSVGAATELDAGSPAAERLGRMAKAAATDAFLFACDRGVQLHGGFGFTWDCDVHFYFKRALWGAATLGDGRHHRRHLAMMLGGRES
jgi:alkylation response protein AidB-like acyl-CoA dehydrogenase